MAWTEKYVDLADGGAGDGTSGDPWASYDEAIAELGALAGPTKIYVRGNGSIAGALAFSNDGTVANPIWWIGCTGTGATWTPIGDSATASKPTLTCSTNQVTVTGDYQTFENLAFTGATTTSGGTVSNTSAGVACTFLRCRFTNTASNTNSRGLSLGGANTIAVACAVSCVTSGTAPTYAAYISGATCAFIGCHIVGGETGIGSINSCLILFNIVEATDSASGIYTDTVAFIIGNTICGAGADGIRVNATTAITTIMNNLIHSATSIAINNSAGDSCGLRTFFNLYYNCGTNGVAGNPEDMEFWNTGTATADPLPNLTEPANSTTDFDVAVSQQRLAFPGIMEALAYAFAGKMTHGALQPLPDFPAVGNVTEDDTVDGATGTYHEATEAEVESGVQFGAGGTEYTGELAAGGGGLLRNPGMSGGIDG